MRSTDAIAVVGATGELGRRICDELVRLAHDAGEAPAPLTLIGRSASALAEVAARVPDARIERVDALDGDALTGALAGVRLAINAAGPLRDTAAPVLAAAIAAGAHYVDVGGEQAAMHALYEHHDALVRRAGLVALPGAGLDAVLGDLAAAWTVSHVIGARDDGDAVREAPAERLADDRAIDDIAITYVLDELVLSPGSQRALFGAIGQRALIWCRDRWEPGPSGDHRRINAGPAGERDAQAFPAGDALTIPRHIAANRVASYVSTTRRPAAATALRLLSRVLPHVPARASALLAPYRAPDADYARTQLAVIAQVRRGFASAQLVVRGSDLYRSSAAITAWCARQLARRATGPVGIRAPGELFRAEPALRALAHRADLALEPSWGPASA